MRQLTRRSSSVAKFVKENATPLWQRRLFAFFGVLIGLCVGFIFEKGKVFSPAVIKAQMFFSDFTMMKMFMAGTAIGMLCVAFLQNVGLQQRVATKLSLGLEWMHGYGANVVGGLIMGVGINIAGACPGTLMAQVGVGIRYSFFTLAGGLTGVVFFMYLHAALQDTTFHIREEAVSIDEHFGIPMHKLAFVVAAIVGVAMLVLEEFKPSAWPLEPTSLWSWVDPYAVAWHPLVAGLLIGLMQIPTFFFLDQNVAVSGSYVMVAGVACGLVSPSGDCTVRFPYLKSFFGPGDWGQLGSTLGLMLGAYLSHSLSGSPIPIDPAGSAARSFVGGFLVLFGARLAGGCASGHGLSGVARLSSASVVVTAAMFTGAIGSGMIAHYLW